MRSLGCLLSRAVIKRLQYIQKQIGNGAICCGVLLKFLPTLERRSPYSVPSLSGGVISSRAFTLPGCV